MEHVSDCSTDACIPANHRTRPPDLLRIPQHHRTITMPPTRREKKPRAPAKRIQFTDSQRETMRNNMHEFEWYGDHEEPMGVLICKDLAKDFAPKFPDFPYDELYEKIKVDPSLDASVQLF